MPTKGDGCAVAHCPHHTRQTAEHRARPTPCGGMRRDAIRIHTTRLTGSHSVFRDAVLLFSGYKPPRHSPLECSPRRARLRLHSSYLTVAPQTRPFYGAGLCRSAKQVLQHFEWTGYMGTPRHFKIFIWGFFLVCQSFSVTLTGLRTLYILSDYKRV